MKPFHFPLESVRVLRKQQEHAAQLGYARRLTTCDHAARQLETAAVELRTGWSLHTHELAVGVTGAKLSALRTWCSVLELRRNERRTALEAARHAAGKAFRQMVAAARARESLDRFHDKSHRAHQHAAQQHEQKQFDELAVQRSRLSVATAAA